MPTLVKSYSEIKRGDFYEDCAFHPCICTSVNAENDEILGISLVDGSFPRACSVQHCGVQLLTLEEALKWKFEGPAKGDLPENLRWWEPRETPGFLP